MLPAVESTLQHSNGFETMAAALHDSTQNARMEREQGNAKMLGRVGRGHLAEVKFLKRTTRWHEDEMCFSWSVGTRYVTELAVLLGFADTRSVMVTRTPGTKATGGNARDALEQLDTFQAATFRFAVGLIGYIVLDRPECQYAR